MLEKEIGLLCEHHFNDCDVLLLRAFKVSYTANPFTSFVSVSMCENNVCNLTVRYSGDSAYSRLFHRLIMLFPQCCLQ